MAPAIMIVEDELIIAKDLQHSIQKLGYDVCFIASSGEKAIECVEQNKPDLIFMDIVLKGKWDGIQTAKMIRSRFDIPIIYLTSHTDSQTLDRAMVTEPFGYMVKPFEVRELHITIEIALYKHKMECERKELLHKLQKALAEVKKLSGLLPICSACKKIRDDKGYWNQLEGYIQEHSEVEFTHGICPECARKLYPELYD
mgnify:CR=1 FL=1